MQARCLGLTADDCLFTYYDPHTTQAALDGIAKIHLALKK